MAKIIDALNERLRRNERFFSFEYFPPRTDDGLANLKPRLKRMQSYGPLFCDITWGAGGATSDLTMHIATHMQQEVGMRAMMHLTCTNMPVEKLSAALSAAKAAGIRNILALRGDPPAGQSAFEAVEGGFASGLDLVRYIRQEHGDWFCIAVAGYPEAHPDVIVEDEAGMVANYEADLDYLKRKVEAGADLIVTQLFYDVDQFLRWRDDVRSKGITVPILPGIMPIVSAAGFKRMTSLCKTRIPEEVSAALDACGGEEAAVKAFGVKLGSDMCRRLLAAEVPGLHMYTLNQETACKAILVELGLIHEGEEGRANGEIQTPARVDA